MNVFYDSQKKQLKPWVIVAFVVVPILFFFVFFMAGDRYAKIKANQPGQKEKDIFE